MSKYSLIINQKRFEVECEDDMPLLWVLRDLIGLTGTKYGCGIAQCGACTVHLDDESIRSCVTPVKSVGGRKITTIEGAVSPIGNLVKEAWILEQVPQCGYCQSGQIMSAISLLRNNKMPTDDDINVYMGGNLCRCGTYPKIKKAIQRASQK